MTHDRKVRPIAVSRRTNPSIRADECVIDVYAVVAILPAAGAPGHSTLGVPAG